MFGNILGQYSKDLNEFYATIREDTQWAIESAKNHFDMGNEESEVDDTIELDSLENVLQAEDLGSHYDDFLETVELDQESIEAIRTKHAEYFEEYVPKTLTEDEFYSRVLYFQHLERRARLLAGQPDQAEDDVLSWGDEDEIDDEIQIEQQHPPIVHDNILQELESIKLQVEDLKMRNANLVSENESLKAKLAAYEAGKPLEQAKEEISEPTQSIITKSASETTTKETVDAAGPIADTSNAETPLPKSQPKANPKKTGNTESEENEWERWE